MASQAESNGLVRWDRAVDDVENWLSTLPDPGPRRLSTPELYSYKPCQYARGWRLAIPNEDNEIILDILVTKHFPWQPPKVALVGESKFKVWPHVEKNNVLCILPDIAESNPSNPARLVQNILSEAVALIEESISGINQDDFLKEFRSYWERSITQDIDLRCLLNTEARTRKVQLWRGKHFSLIGENADDIQKWHDNYYAGNKVEALKTEEGGLFWLDKPWLPSQYPQSGNDVIKFVCKIPEGEALLCSLVEEESKKIGLIFGAMTKDGPCYWSVSILEPKGKFRGIGRKNLHPLTNGFRPGQVPKRILISRYFGSAGINTSSIKRIDSSWIHGRDSDPSHVKIKIKKVAIIGCGSLGSQVASLLAQSGVGNLLLIDPELLQWSNVGRHQLGAKSVGSGKAIALAKKLKQDYPHLHNVTAKDKEWIEVAEEGLLNTCDLIISTVGSWRVEGHLSEWHTNNISSIPIIFGWLEPFGCAAHSVGIFDQKCCFACNLEETGAPIYRATDWKESPLKQEPACGVFYQPYDPVSLSNAANLVAGMALETLVEPFRSSIRRTWVTSSKLLASSGGYWNESIKNEITKRPEGSFVFELPYHKNAKCKWCVKPNV